MMRSDFVGFLKWVCKRVLVFLLRPRDSIHLTFSKKLSIMEGQKINPVLLNDIESIRTTEFINYLVLSRASIAGIVKDITSEKYANIFEQFCMRNPTVTFISLYETKPIGNREISVYANHWHTDDTLPPNCVKFFQLPKKLDLADGPMEFLSEEITRKNRKKFFVRGSSLKMGKEEIRRFTSDDHSLFLDASRCLHRAGVPEKDHKRRMLMVQICESKKLSDIENLYQLQGHKEPTLLNKS